MIVFAGATIDNMTSQVMIDKEVSTFFRKSCLGIPNDYQIMIHGEGPDAVERTLALHLRRYRWVPYLGS
jgi:hypothetical protein